MIIVEGYETPEERAARIAEWQEICKRQKKREREIKRRKA
jgi:hypothetical protein